MSLIIEGLTLNNSLTIFRFIGKQARRTMAHREKGTTFQVTTQPLSSIRMVTKSRWSKFNRNAIEGGDGKKLKRGVVKKDS